MHSNPPQPREHQRQEISGVKKEGLFICEHTSKHVGDLGSPTRDQTHTPCSGSQESYHWTAREVLGRYHNYLLIGGETEAQRA